MSKRHYAAISAITTYYRRIFTLLWKACLRRLSSPFSYCFFLPVHLFQLLFIICFLSLSIPLLIALLSSLLKLFPSLSLTISLLFGCLTYTILTFFSFFLMHSCFYLTFLSLMLIFLSLFLFSIYFYSSEYISFSFIPIYLHIYVSLFLFSLYTIHLPLSLFSLFLFLSHSISLFCLFLCVSLSLSITLTCWSLCRIFSIPLAFYLPYSLYRFVQRFSSIPSSSSSTLPSVCPWPKPPKPMVFTVNISRAHNYSLMPENKVANRQLAIQTLKIEGPVRRRKKLAACKSDKNENSCVSGEYLDLEELCLNIQ